MTKTDRILTIVSSIILCVVVITALPLAFERAKKLVARPVIKDAVTTEAKVTVVACETDPNAGLAEMHIDMLGSLLSRRIDNYIDVVRISRLAPHWSKADREQLRKCWQNWKREGRCSPHPDPARSEPAPAYPLWPEDIESIAPPKAAPAAEVDYLGWYLARKLEKGEIESMSYMIPGWTDKERRQLLDSSEKWRRKFEELDGGQHVEIVRSFRLK